MAFQYRVESKESHGMVTVKCYSLHFFSYLDEAITVDKSRIATNSA